MNKKREHKNRILTTNRMEDKRTNEQTKRNSQNGINTKKKREKRKFKHDLKN